MGLSSGRFYRRIVGRLKADSDVQQTLRGWFLKVGRMAGSPQRGIESFLLDPERALVAADQGIEMARGT